MSSQTSLWKSTEKGEPMLEKTGRLARLLAAAEQIRKEVLTPKAAVVDAEARVPVETLGRMWDQGFLSLLVPRESDGQGASLLEATLLVEELARGCSSSALLVVIQCLGTLPILLAAAPGQKEKWLKEIVHGRKLLAFALSEPEGEGPAESRADLEAGNYRLAGRKAFVTNAGEADWLIVFAATDSGAGLKSGLSAFLLERGAAGLHLARTEPRLGLRGLPPADLVFDACTVAADGVIGTPGAGYALAENSLSAGCILLAGLATGVMQAAVDRLREEGIPARPALQEGKNHPSEYLLSEIAMTLEASRALAYRAAGAWDLSAGASGPAGGYDFKGLSLTAKCFTTEAAVRVLQAAMELKGQAGLLHDHPLSRLLRDAQCLPVLLRPNPSQRKVIARSLLK